MPPDGIVVVELRCKMPSERRLNAARPDDGISGAYLQKMRRIFGVRDCTRPHVIMQFGRNIMRMENQFLGNL
ncbi:hypothetical protein CVS42_05125 [Aeromonas veronii]|nr:hypothetical protein CVS42_05125 [Aeromonas veronii]